MAHKALPPQDYLLSRFDYDQETGTLIWRPVEPGTYSLGAAQWNLMFAGKVAGTCQARKYAVRLDGLLYVASRIIWKLMTGHDPVGLIDHRDTNPHNNAFGNLRESTNPQNCRNVGLRRDSSSGIKGVAFVNNRHGTPYKWKAYIRVDDKLIHLGYFDTSDEAAAAYRAAAIKHHGEFARWE
jgi:hypothetical protein